MTRGAVESQSVNTFNRAKLDWALSRLVRFQSWCHFSQGAGDDLLNCTKILPDVGWI